MHMTSYTEDLSSAPSLGKRRHENSVAEEIRAKEHYQASVLKTTKLPNNKIRPFMRRHLFSINVLDTATQQIKTSVTCTVKISVCVHMRVCVCVRLCIRLCIRVY